MTVVSHASLSSKRKIKEQEKKINIKSEKWKKRKGKIKLLVFKCPIIGKCYDLKLKLRLHLGKDLKVDKRIDWSGKV